MHALRTIVTDLRGGYVVRTNIDKAKIAWALGRNLHIKTMGEAMDLLANVKRIDE